MPEVNFGNQQNILEKMTSKYKLAKLYAEKANVNVVYVDYRLAFQGKYPSPLNDCIAAYNFVLANADKLNFDTDRLVLAGEPATFVCVGESDGIANYRTMKTRINNLAAMGIPTEYHSYVGLGHGFGLGVGTVAEGWFDQAVAFWERNS